ERRDIRERVLFDERLSRQERSLRSVGEVVAHPEHAAVSRRQLLWILHRAERGEACHDRAATSDHHVIPLVWRTNPDLATIDTWTTTKITKDAKITKWMVLAV